MRNTVAATALLFALTGCASIMNGQTQAVTIKSEPVGATVSVKNRSGEQIHSGTAPVTLTLKRGAGYFSSESYTVSMSKDGHAHKEITITGTINGWYFGNILFGGLIGMLAVDPVTGAMYSFPETVTGTLDAAPRTSSAGDTLTLVSTTSLTPEQMKHARLVVAAQ